MSSLSSPTSNVPTETAWIAAKSATWKMIAEIYRTKMVVMKKAHAKMRSMVNVEDVNTDATIFRMELTGASVIEDTLSTLQIPKNVLMSMNAKLSDTIARNYVPT